MTQSGLNFGDSDYKVKRYGCHSYTVGQLVRAADTKVVTIRYYKQQGLPPRATRNALGYRQYTTADCDRLLFTRRSRSLGFSLDDIRELLGVVDHCRASCAA